MALDFVAGCIGGGAGVLVGHPLDTVKVKLQVQDPKNPIYKGTWRTFSQIFKKEGFKGLYAGVNSPLGGMAFINAIVFGVYGNTLDAIHNYQKRHSIEMNTTAKLLAVGSAGSVAGLAQVFVCAPMELAKIRLQVDSGKKTYKSMTDCLVKEFNKKGFRGIYKGFNITVVRDIPSFFLYFSVYEALKTNLNKILKVNESIPLTMLNGGLAGCSSWTSVYAIDVIKTRMQMDGMGGKPRKYRNSWHCLTEGYKDEGYKFLFRGINSTLARAFPVNAVTFTVVALILRLRNWNLSDIKWK